MEYKKLTAKEAKPKRTRKAVAKFETTPAWRYMKADIDKGLKPNEALQVTLSAEDKEKFDLRGRRSVARFLQKYLAAKGLPYTVRSFDRRETGHTFFVVEYIPALRQRA